MARVLAALRSGVAAFFNWWFGELAALIPGWLRRPFQRTAGALVLDISGRDVFVRRVSGRSVTDLGRTPGNPDNPEVEAVEISRLLRQGKRGRFDIVLRLPSDNALRRTLNLPIAASENLREVLTFEMDRQTPFTAEQVYFDFRVGARDTESQHIEVELIAVPKPEVDAALARAAGWGVEPDIVDIVTDDQHAAPSINLLPSVEAPSGSSVGRLGIALALIAVMLAATVVYLPLDRQRRSAEAHMAEARRARVTALAAIKLRDEVKRLTNESEYLAERRRNTPRAVEIIDEVTRLLPDHTWLQQLRIREDSVRLTGLSGAASSLIGAIQKSPMFTDASFRSPVTQDVKAGKERFTLSAKLAAAERLKAAKAGKKKK